MAIEMRCSGLNSITNTQRKWSDYAVVNGNQTGSQFIRGYIERFNTVSFFNEYMGFYHTSLLWVNWQHLMSVFLFMEHT